MDAGFILTAPTLRQTISEMASKSMSTSPNRRGDRRRPTSDDVEEVWCPKLQWKLHNLHFCVVDFYRNGNPMGVLKMSCQNQLSAENGRWGRQIGSLSVENQPKWPLVKCRLRRIHEDHGNEDFSCHSQAIFLNLRTMGDWLSKTKRTCCCLLCHCTRFALQCCEATNSRNRHLKMTCPWTTSRQIEVIS